MRKLLIIIFVIMNGLCHSQTLKVDIEANSVTYSSVLKKAFVAVSNKDENYPNKLLQLDPYNGTVEKNLQLNGDPLKIKFTQDNQHLYILYKSNFQIDKVNLSDFHIVNTIQIGVSSVIDIAISPIDENSIVLVLGYDCYPSKIVMYKNGILQPKLIEDNIMDVSSLCFKNDGKWLYGHNGCSTGFQGYLIKVEEDRIVYDNVAWTYMIGSFGEIKNHNDLIFGCEGHVVDPFSDSIPLVEAQMPVKWITNDRSGFDFSIFHNCYIFGHQTDYNAYISFFHEQYYNYLGSLLVEGKIDYIMDIDVVDLNHFILVSLSINNNYKKSLLFYSVEGKQKSEKNFQNGQFKNWFENIDLIKLPIINDNNRNPRLRASSDECNE